MRVPGTIFSDRGSLDQSSEVGIAVGTAIADDLGDHLDRRERLLKMGLAAGVGGLLLGLVLVGLGLVAVGGGLAALGLVGGGGIGLYAQRQEPDVSVQSVSLRYWTGYLFPSESGTVVYDSEGVISESTFTLRQIPDADPLKNAESALAATDDLPMVMDHGDDIEETVQNRLSTVTNTVTDADETQLAAPLVADDDPLATGLQRLERYAQRDEATEIGDVNATEEVKQLQMLEQAVVEDDTETTLESVKETSASTVETLTEAQSRAVDLLDEHIRTASNILSLPTYTFYCPTCREDGVSSTLDVHGAETVSWTCSTCHSEFEEASVIPKHRMRDELVEDIWDALWIEKDDQRRQIYEEIEDQKSELETREFEQRREEIRTAWDRIKDIRSKIRDLETQAKAGEGSIDAISSKMVEYKHLGQERRQQFLDDVTSERERIRERTDEIIEETRNLNQQKLEEAEQEVDEAAELRRADEERRHQDQIAAQMMNAKATAMVAEQIHEQNKAKQELGER